MSKAFNPALDTVTNTHFSPFSSNFVTQKESSSSSSSTTNAFWLSEADFAQPADLSSPFSSSEAVRANIFDPMKIETEEISICGSGTFCGNLDHGLCELSAGSASSMETALVPCYSYKQQHAEDKKKKVGRPIAYKGDPNAADLTEKDRRRIKRRIANRESARRVRARRQGTLEEFQVKVDQITAHNAQMVVHIAESEGRTVLIKSHLRDCELQWHKALANNAWLHQQLALLSTEVQDQLLSAEGIVRPTSDKIVHKPTAEIGDMFSSYNAAPVTGICCSLIEELPTMALPMPDIMAVPMLDLEECPNFML